MTSRVHVAAAVIYNHTRQVLIAKRALNSHQGGLWEFPGGKLERNESAETALRRELLEELGIEVTDCQPLLQISHDYPDKRVLLDVWVVTAYSGELYGREQQEVRWVSRQALAQYDFPEANRAILKAVLADGN